MRIKSALENYVFVLPAALLFVVFYLIPFVWVFRVGLYEWDGIVPTKVFVGLGNFKEILLHDKVWWTAMGNAGYITLIALTLQNTLAFCLAWACDRQIRMKHVYRLLFFIPPVLSEVVVGLVWQWILDGHYGLLNSWLTDAGFPHLARNWLSDPATALNAVAIVHCWKGFGWGFLIFLAGLQTIPRELYEAARADGANAWRIFRHITLPLMMPVAILVAILTILGTMQGFVMIMAMTDGGPGYHTQVPVLRILASMMPPTSRFGYSCAQGISFGLILVTLSFMQYRFGALRRDSQ